MTRRPENDDPREPLPAPTIAPEKTMSSALMQRLSPSGLKRSAIILLLFLSLLPFLPALFFPFVWDDAVFIEKNTAIHTLQPLTNYFTDPETLSSKNDYNHKIYRPLRTLAFAIIHQISGLSPINYHLLNIVLHMACTLLVLFIGLRFDTSIRSATFAAAIFAVHPVHAEAVAWVSSLGDGLSTFFFLLSIYLGSANRPAHTIAALGLCLPLALLSKEMAFTLPMIFLLLRLWRRPSTPLSNRSWIPVVSAAIIAALYLAWRTHVLGAVGQTPFSFAGFIEAVSTAHLVIHEYTQMLLFPMSLCPLRTEIDTSWWRHIPALVSIFIFITVAIRGFSERKPAALFAMVYLITLLPVLNFLPVVIQVAERFAYLPSVWFCFLVSEGFEFFHARASITPTRADRIPRILNLAALILVTALTLRLVYAVDIWKTDQSVASAQVRCDRPDPNAWWNLGNDAVRRKNWPEAKDAFSRLLQFDPSRSSTLNNLAYVHLQLKEWQQAETVSRKSLNSSPDNPMALNNLGAALLQQGRFADAATSLERAISADPDNYPAYLNLARLQILRREFSPARAVLLKALELRPGAGEAVEMLDQLSALSSPENKSENKQK